jgi:hypothetical protein
VSRLTNKHVLVRADDGVAIASVTMQEHQVAETGARSVCGQSLDASRVV